MSSQPDAQLRSRAAERYEGRCGYCGTEMSVDNSAIDFHQPLSHGGAKTLDNAVYSCPRCALYKGDYWHESVAPHMRLLHPLHDDLSLHLREDAQCQFVGETPEGRFYIDRLRLNRPALIDLRRVRNLVARAREIDDELRSWIEAAASGPGR